MNDNPDYNEYQSYFANMSDAFINMLVLLTTANNPDGKSLCDMRMYTFLVKTAFILAQK